MLGGGLSLALRNPWMFQEADLEPVDVPVLQYFMKHRKSKKASFLYSTSMF